MTYFGITNASMQSDYYECGFQPNKNKVTVSTSLSTACKQIKWWHDIAASEEEDTVQRWDDSQRNNNGLMWMVTTDSGRGCLLVALGHTHTYMHGTHMAIFGQIIQIGHTSIPPTNIINKDTQGTCTWCRLGL